MNTRRVKTLLFVAFGVLFIAIGGVVLSNLRTVSGPYGQRVLIVAGIICCSMGFIFFALCLDEYRNDD
ncbi:hypothetical protein SAMN05421858_3816 [Haladaptatus litoreus]|uniref:Uncharacterized protein n=1 Tax=Haladaptatus litoreus TaxID=553468 RepID=A0A1N7DWT3_9EURY|nr:hypothetical protein [Haladaptatus litoreus]SIR80309.1 hypothetical protein SAMN05421858_3816 [Haladaptatus litoreus]